MKKSGNAIWTEYKFSEKKTWEKIRKQKDVLELNANYWKENPLERVESNSEQAEENQQSWR